MTAVAQSIGWISPEEYLEGEKWSDIRHEYVDGQIFAMAGTSIDHNRIAGSILTELSLRLRGGSCEAFMNDIKVRIPEPANVYYYPDVLVARDPSDNAQYYRERPSHIFEVISPETERTDRREKMLAYRDIPGIKSYIILEQDQMKATVLRPAPSGWTTEIVQGPDGILSLPDLRFEIPLARIYERTALTR
jgi:Uma2 family endonuclease